MKTLKFVRACYFVWISASFTFKTDDLPYLYLARGNMGKCASTLENMYK